ncbi:MAG: O-antigen ligase family protein [Colwellia sp.]
MKKSQNKKQFFAFLILIFWLPIPLGSNRPWAWSILEIGAFSLLALQFVLASYHQKNILRNLKQYKPLILLFATVQCWLIIQYIPLPIELITTLSPNLTEIYTPLDLKFATLSLDPSETHVESLKGLAYLSLMLLTLLLVTTDKRVKQLLFTLLLAGTFQASYGSLQAMTGNSETWIHGLKNSVIATGGFVYKNHFANFLLLCISMGIGLLISNLSLRQAQNNRAKMRDFLKTLLGGKAVIRIALAIMVIGLVMSRSRMGNAAFFIAMTTTGFFALLYFKERSRGLTILLISLFIIDTFILGAWFGIDKIKNRIEQTSFSQETRDEVNIYGLELIKKYPITGTGAGSFYTVFPMVQGDDVPLFYDHAHNDYLQFSIEYGLPATLLLAWLILLSLWQTIVAMRERKHTLMKGTAFGCMMAIIAMLIHISVDFNLQAPANAAYFVIILTLAWQSRYLNRHKGSRT